MSIARAVSAKFKVRQFAESSLNLLKVVSSIGFKGLIKDQCECQNLGTILCLAKVDLGPLKTALRPHELINRNPSVGALVLVMNLITALQRQAVANPEF